MCQMCTFGVNFLCQKTTECIKSFSCIKISICIGALTPILDILLLKSRPFFVDSALGIFKNKKKILDFRSQFTLGNEFWCHKN